MIRHIIRYATTSLMLLVIAGCTKENLENCITGLKLQYYYTLNKDYVNLFGPEVHQMNIYVFDKDNLYYDTFIVDDPGDLSNNNSITIPLPAGKWTIVSWGGDMETYMVGTLDHQGVGLPAIYHDGLDKGETTLDEFRLMINHDEESIEEVVITKTPGKLFYGNVTQVETRPDAVSGATIGITKNTNTLILKIGGASNLIPEPSPLVSRASNGFDIYATINNGRYDFNHAIAEYARIVRYIQPWSIDGNDLLINFTVMRLMEDDRTATLTIESPMLPGGKIDIPIVETILSNPDYNNQEDLDREDTFTFELNISSDLYITLFVNDWEIIRVYPN